MKHLRGIIVALSIVVLVASARPAAAAGDDTSRNILIGALIGAGIGAIVGVILYLARDKPPQPAAALRAPANFAAVGLNSCPSVTREAEPAAAGSAGGFVLRF